MKYRGTEYSICNLKSSVPKEIPVVFYNGSNYWLSIYQKILSRKIWKTTYLFKNVYSSKYPDYE